jgi:hypothetical protein
MLTLQHSPTRLQVGLESLRVLVGRLRLYLSVPEIGGRRRAREEEEGGDGGEEMEAAVASRRRTD